MSSTLCTQPLLRPRTHFQLGYDARLVSNCWFRELARLPFIICWICVLDTCIRYYLRAPGEISRLCIPARIIYETCDMQDKNDDVQVGIRSTALLFGENTRPIISSLAAGSLSLITCGGFLNGQGIPFYIGTGIAAVQLARVLATVDFNNQKSCWRGFQSCGWAGFWIWMGTLADYIMILSI